MTRSLFAIVARDLKLAARIGGSGALGLVFFLMLVTLVPFALGPDLNLLARIGPAILWLAAVLATLIGLDRLFQADEEDGSLDLLCAAPAPLELIVLAKAVAHWLATGLPLALAAPLFGLLVALTPTAMLAMTATLIVGTPALTFIGAVGAALTASIRRGGLILAILALPLMIPTLIFGVSAADAASGGAVPIATPLLILAALSLIAGVVGTIGAAAALRWGNRSRRAGPRPPGDRDQRRLADQHAGDHGTAHGIEAGEARGEAAEASGERDRRQSAAGTQE